MASSAEMVKDPDLTGKEPSTSPEAEAQKDGEGKKEEENSNGGYTVCNASTQQ